MAGLDDVINTLIAEAYAEGDEGMRRVAETIINRAAIRGLTPDQVVRQRRQYTGYEAPGPAAVRAQQSGRARDRAMAAWELALQDGDPTNGADHYYNPNVVSPSWANSMTSKGDYGNHSFYASRPIPPGSLPQVATLMDTVPRTPPAPVTASPDLATLRKANAANNTVNQTFSSLNRPKPTLTLGDQIGMSPIPGGRQQAPMFDAAFDTRLGAMRMLNTPMDTQGMAAFASRAPAPRPATMSPGIAGTRMLNATFAGMPKPAALTGVGQPPSTRTVTSVPVSGNRPTLTASDRTRGNSGITTVATIPTVGLPRPRPNTTAVVASYPTTPAPRPGQTFAGQDRGAPRAVPRVQTAAVPQSFAGQDRGAPRPAAPRAPILVAQPAGTYDPNKIQDRLAPNAPGVGGINTPLIPYPVSVASRPLPRPTITPPVQTAAIPPRVAPRPFDRPVGVGTVLDVAPPRPRIAPIPFDRPNFGMGGPDLAPPAIPRRRPMNPNVTPPPSPLSGIMNALFAALPAGFIPQGGGNSRSGISIADRLSDGASGGGDIGRGPAIDRVSGPHVAALHRR